MPRDSKAPADKVIELSEKAPYLPWGAGTDKTMVSSPPPDVRRERLRKMQAGEAVDSLTTRRIALIEPSAYLTEQEAEDATAYIVAACNSAPALARDSKALERVREILGPLMAEYRLAKSAGNDLVTTDVERKLLALLTPQT